MNEREKLIVKYASDLKEKCNLNPNMELLTKVTIGCGPSIYNSDSSTLSGSSEAEQKTIRDKFLIKKLGLFPEDNLDQGIQAVIEQYGRSNRHKYRAVFYYLLSFILEKNRCINSPLYTFYESTICCHAFLILSLLSVPLRHDTHRRLQ